MFEDTTSADKVKMKEVIEIDRLRQIEGILKNIQRKSQAIGSLAKKTWYREHQSYKYISHEVDVIYAACARVLREFGGSK